MQFKAYLILSALTIISCQDHSNEGASANAMDLLAQASIIDLTHSFDSETVYWVTAKEFALDTVAFGQTPKGYFYSANNFEAAEHGGTHIDAPIHFAKNTQSVDEIPLEKLIGTAIKIDVRENALDNPDYQITVEDFKNWETEEGGKIPSGAIVLLQTGYSKFYADKLKYLGTDQRGEEAVAKLHFPGLSPEAASWLIESRSISAIGLDTPSIDYGQSQLFESHVLLLGENIPAFENLTNLDQLPPSGFSVIALPMKIKGGSGGPLRIVALLE
jgi:kynurenine formamidase